MTLHVSKGGFFIADVRASKTQRLPLITCLPKCQALLCTVFARCTRCGPRTGGTLVAITRDYPRLPLITRNYLVVMRDFLLITIRKLKPAPFTYLFTLYRPCRSSSVRIWNGESFTCIVRASCENGLAGTFTSVSKWSRKPFVFSTSGAVSKVHSRVKEVAANVSVSKTWRYWLHAEMARCVTCWDIGWLHF